MASGICYLSPSFIVFESGFVTAIDPLTGALTVGGSTVRLNDPLGVYGSVQSPDPLWGVDPANPSVHTMTGYPMCIPSNNAAWCKANRPAIANLPPNQQQFVNLAVGDYVLYTGVKVGV